MSSIKSYISNFTNRAGSYVFSATILARLLSFFCSWVALKFCDNSKLGIVLYAWNIITMILPFVGGGLHQSLLRYGAITTNLSGKKQILQYVVKKGLIVSLIISSIISIASYIYPFKSIEISNYLALLSWCFVFYFILEVIKIQLRLEHNNKKFAIVDMVFNSILTIFVIPFTYYFEEKGYAASILFTPIVTVLLFHKTIITNNTFSQKNMTIDTQFWKYGLFAGLTGVSSTFLFGIDFILIGRLIKNPEAVTVYKYISLIPFSIIFLPRVFMSTDFVAFTEKIRDRIFIKNYIKSYTSLFLVVSLIFCSTAFILAEEILLIFDKSFVAYKDSFNILCFGITGVLIFRGLYGNLLSSIGKIEVNSYISIIAIIINIVSNYYLIPKLGIKGACISSAIVMWFTGIFSYLLFSKLYKKI